MSKYHQITHKLIRRFLAVSALLATLFIIIFFLYREFLSGRTWYGDETFYPLFHWLNQYKGISIGLVIAGTALGVAYYFIRKTLNYFNEAAQAVESLVNRPEEAIFLSDDLSDFQREINRLREESLFNARAAKEAEQRKNDLIVYLAHDLRTPLTSVIGYLTLLKEEPQISPELRARYLNISLNKAERLEQLVNEFFEITRFNLTTLTLEKQPIDLSLMLKQLTYEFLPILAPKNLSFELMLTDGVIANVDPEKIARVFDNLLRNAVHYSFNDTPLTVELSQSAAAVTIIFKNHWHKIPPEKLAHLFEPFYRMDQARSSETGGTGLGLPITKEIIEAHGGTISATSTNGEFSITLALPRTA